MRKPEEKFSPLGSRVLVKMLPVSEGGLAIPEKYAELPDRGRVVAVGPGKPGEPMSLKVGDKVILDKQANIAKTRIGDEDFLILYESEIAGTIE